MLTKDKCITKIQRFKSSRGLDISDENIAAALHIMNSHGIGVDTALDQSSRAANDHGIDAWQYTEEDCHLYIYQSKLTESRALALRGLDDLDNAREWLEQVVVDGAVESVPSDNTSLFNLFTRLSTVRAAIIQIHFCLISLFDSNEIEDATEYHDFETRLSRSRLNDAIRQRPNGKLRAEASAYNLEGVPPPPKPYAISKIPGTRVELRPSAHLDLTYVSLDSLVQLYRRRGDILFDKNIRLSLMTTKEGRERLRNPMEATLDLITSGNLSPSVFPFYHVGVTIAAAVAEDSDANFLNLEAPSIINGCQTIVIANEYLKKLEKRKDPKAIRIFREISVIAKVVIGTSNDELREITNANNRQNPIENWQLFSNEPIHIEIEAALKDVGIFYERQKGKFDSVMKNTSVARYFPNTNGTYIKVLDLAQIIALARREMQWAAKPSEIFLNKDNHDRVFDRTIPAYPHDIVYASNLFRAIKRGLNTYLRKPAHANNRSELVYKRPIVRTYLYSLALLYFYQNDKKGELRHQYSEALNKNASAKLVDHSHGFYQRVVTPVRNWYVQELNEFEVEVSTRALGTYFEKLAVELGVDQRQGAAPFTSLGIDGGQSKTSGL